MKTINLSELKQQTGIGFGTSGIRGLATELTPTIVYSYTQSFIDYVTEKYGKPKEIAIAGDYRDSTPAILRIIGQILAENHIEIVNGGNVPTPAITYFGIKNNIPSIMVTGSHIPGDRNGIKYVLADRELLKSDEAGVSMRVVDVPEEIVGIELPEINTNVRQLYIERFKKRFEGKHLNNLKVGLYQHSAVGRDILKELLEYFGAEVEVLNRSDKFVAVDTEVIEDNLKNMGKEWGKSNYNAIVSTDGDSDRPLVGDENGSWIRSDILGIIVAKYWQANKIITTVSCNTALEKSGWFNQIVRTKIGSPYVVEELINSQAGAVGYEANGGFFEKDLPTRDAIIVVLTILFLATKTKISEIFDQLPKRFTESSSVKGFPTDKAIAIIGNVDYVKNAVVKKIGYKIVDENKLDGLRLILENQDIVHFRPSMNSPEFRIYVETDNKDKSIELCQKMLDLIKSWDDTNNLG